jgi:hypothetical protein
MNSGMSRAITFSEWQWTLLIALIVIVAQQVPYALGYLCARPETEYMGLLINLEDSSYLSAIQQGINGAWLYRNPFTTEEHAPVFIQVFYLALGHWARGLNLSAVAMWHVARVGSSLILAILLFAFIGQWLRDPTQRRVAFVLALLGAGWDFFWLPFEVPDPLSAAPLDWRMPESHLFFSMLTYPHYAVNITLTIVVLWCIWRAWNDELTDTRRWMLALVAGVMNSVLVLVYPFFLLVPLGVLGGGYVWLVWRARKMLWRQAMLGAVAFLLPVPLLLYYLSVLMTNPVMQLWNAQAVTLSPNPIHYLLSYAPYLILGLWGLKRDMATRQYPLALLWMWIGIIAILVYIPVNPQRRFVQGLHIPMTIVAINGLYGAMLPWCERTRVFTALCQRPRYSADGLRRLLVITLLGITSLASVYVWLGGIVQSAVLQPYPLFRPTLELQAMDWLRANTNPSEAVLSSYWTGSFIPARAGNRVFVGQRYETIRFDEKRAAAEKFFDAATDDAWRIALLREHRIAYVFWGRAERDLGAFDPERVPYLQRVFANDEARIYRVKLP